jgi:hypothetical protein
VSIACLQGAIAPAELVGRLKAYCQATSPPPPTTSAAAAAVTSTTAAAGAAAAAAEADGSDATASQKAADRAKVLELQAKLKLLREQKGATEAETEKEAEIRRREEGKALLEAERKRADLARAKEQREAEEAAAAAKETRKLKHAAMARRTDSRSSTEPTGADALLAVHAPPSIPPPPPSPRAHGFFITCSTVQQRKVFCPSPSLHLIRTICSIQPCVAAPPPTDLSTRTLTVSGASAASSRPSQGKSIGAVDASESREGGESASPGAAAEGETLVLLRLPSRSTIKRAFLSDATLDDVRAFVRNSPEYVILCV